MKLLPIDRALFRRRLLRINVLAGLILFVVGIGLTLTGEYSSLAKREAAETLYNYIALGGLVYAAVSWMFCVMSKPFWFPLGKTKQ